MIVGRLVAKRAAVAVAGNRGVDEPGVAAGEGLPAVAEAVHHAGTEVLHEDIAGGQDRVENLSVVRALEVERDAFLVAVECHEIPGLSSHEGKPLARIVADIGPFDLDDAGPQIRQDHGAIRTRENPRHVDDGNAVERRLLQGIGGKSAHVERPSEAPASSAGCFGPRGADVASPVAPCSSPVRYWALPRPNDQSLSVFSTMLTITSVGGMPHERSSSAQSFR